MREHARLGYVDARLSRWLSKPMPRPMHPGFRRSPLTIT